MSIMGFRWTIGKKLGAGFGAILVISLCAAGVGLLEINRLSQAAEQMNQVTQQNAANSEESAAAAEELSSQAQYLQAMVGEFRISQE